MPQQQPRAPAGTSEMHFVSAMDTVWGTRPVLGLAETVCTGAADGYGRMAHRPALTLLHLGPGLANSLANLHNARRASTPLINVIGDMATWHKVADPLLNMDIPALATTVSKWVHVCGLGEDLGAAMAAACKETEHAEAVSGSRIATIIIPHDVSWERTPPPIAKGNGMQPRKMNLQVQDSAAIPQPSGMTAFIKECAAALKACPRGKAALYIGGRAGIKEGKRPAAAQGSSVQVSCHAPAPSFGLLQRA